MSVCHFVRPLPNRRAGLGALAGHRALVAAAVLVVAASGCKKPDPKACDDYNAKMCEVAGPESPTCKEIKSTTELMGPAACAAAIAELPKAKTKLEERRKACDQLATKLCGEIGNTTQTCEMVKTQLKNAPVDQCTMMLQDAQYGRILADLKEREARNQPLSPEKSAEIAKPGAPSFGPADSKVTIVEFSDFQCPYCSRAADVTKKLKEKYGTKVRFVFRQFPLSFHQQAHLAAQASLAANAQGKFWEYHDKLFADQKKLGREDLEAAAKELGLDMAAFKKALDGKEFEAAVDADLKLGESAQVSGTPTVFVNGKRIDDASNFEALSKLIDETLAKSS